MFARGARRGRQKNLCGTTGKKEFSTLKGPTGTIETVPRGKTKGTLKALVR